jgi:hypothetical protein
MTVRQLGKNEEFIRRILTAMQDIDELEYISLEESLTKLIKSITGDLNHIVDIYERFNFDAIASVFSLDEKRLENNNKEFLDGLVKYISGVDRAFNHRAVTYCNLGSTVKPRISEKSIEKEKIKKFEILKSLAQVEDAFISAIKRVNKFSHKLMEEAKNRKINNLPKYEYEFKQLELFEILDWAKAIELLTTKRKITHK